MNGGIINSNTRMHLVGISTKTINTFVFSHTQQYFIIELTGNNGH
jgi:hypothetical protein